MESLSDTKWDVVISGTGLHPSLLALALSRSDRNILHADPDDYYGGPEAAFSLQEADDWARRHESPNGDGLFAAARVATGGDGLASSRAYSIALAPQVIHAKSELLSQLVSSRAYRQLEFLAVGSLYVYQPATESSPSPALNRIPSTREDVFSDAAIPARAKRSLMKFLNFVLEYEQEPHADRWKPRAGDPLADFLASEFKLDASLQAYVTALTLSSDGKVSVEVGLTSIHRHLTSMGVFGTGFAAVYPKWGGLSEVAQVGCRASAVGGAVYMLGTGINGVHAAESADASEGNLQISLTNDMTVNTKYLVRGDAESRSDRGAKLSRLTAILSSAMSHLFGAVIEDAPTPAVAVVAFPPGSATDAEGNTSESPIYAMVHSSDTGECPAGQCVVYLSCTYAPKSDVLLTTALANLLAAVPGEQATPRILYRLSYEQVGGEHSLEVNGNVVNFPPLPLDLAFNDSALESVREAWKLVTARIKVDEDAEYMVFEDREGSDDQDNIYEA